MTLYHRCLAHGSVQLSPWMRKCVIHLGVWITGIDPKVWACMHRMHHAHSDTKLDPHSPSNLGMWGVMRGQFVSYQWAMMGLQGKGNAYTAIVSDLDFPVSAHNLKKLWWLPHALHAMIGIIIAVASGGVWLGISYWVGMVNHPLQGWLVNAFAHKYGYRNFDTTDQSTNNTLVALLILGEGYQNNHHAFPRSAKFSVRWYELDSGYMLCRIAQWLGAVKIPTEDLQSLDRAA